MQKQGKIRCIYWAFSKYLKTTIYNICVTKESNDEQKCASNKRKQSVPMFYMAEHFRCILRCAFNFEALTFSYISLNKTSNKKVRAVFFFVSKKWIAMNTWYLLRFENRDFIENFGGKLKDRCAFFPTIFRSLFNQTKASMQYAMLEWWKYLARNRSIWNDCSICIHTHTFAIVLSVMI